MFSAKGYYITKCTIQNKRSTYAVRDIFLKKQGVFNCLTKETNVMLNAEYKQWQKI